MISGGIVQYIFSHEESQIVPVLVSNPPTIVLSNWHFFTAHLPGGDLLPPPADV